MTLTTTLSKANHITQSLLSIVRKTIVFHCALVDKQKESSKKADSTKDKQILAKVLIGNY